MCSAVAWAAHGISSLQLPISGAMSSSRFAIRTEDFSRDVRLLARLQATQWLPRYPHICLRALGKHSDGAYILACILARCWDQAELDNTLRFVANATCGQGRFIARRRSEACFHACMERCRSFSSMVVIMLLFGTLHAHESRV